MQETADFGIHVAPTLLETPLEKVGEAGARWQQTIKQRSCMASEMCQSESIFVPAWSRLAAVLPVPGPGAGFGVGLSSEGDVNGRKNGPKVPGPKACTVWVLGRSPSL